MTAPPAYKAVFDPVNGRLPDVVAATVVEGVGVGLCDGDCDGDWDGDGEGDLVQDGEPYPYPEVAHGVPQPYP